MPLFYTDRSNSTTPNLCTVHQKTALSFDLAITEVWANHFSQARLHFGLLSSDGLRLVLLSSDGLQLCLSSSAELPLRLLSCAGLAPVGKAAVEPPPVPPTSQDAG